MTMTEVIIGDICTIEKGTKIIYDENSSILNNEYSVIGAGRNPMKYMFNNYNTDENTILCSAIGPNSGFISKYNTKVWVDNNCYKIIPKNNSINNNYLYYLFKNNQHKINELKRGNVVNSISINDLRNMKILIHSHELQLQIVEYCINSDIYIQELENNIENRRNITRNYLLNEFS